MKTTLEELRSLPGGACRYGASDKASYSTADVLASTLGWWVLVLVWAVAIYLFWEPIAVKALGLPSLTYWQIVGLDALIALILPDWGMIDHQLTPAQAWDQKFTKACNYCLLSFIVRYFL